MCYINVGTPFAPVLRLNWRGKVTSLKERNGRKEKSMRKLIGYVILALGIFSICQMNPVMDFIKKVLAGPEGGG